MPAETKELRIVALQPERVSGAGKKYWVSRDSQGVEWLVWQDQQLHDAVEAELNKTREYRVSISEKGDKTYRSINAVPGVYSPQQQSGGGGRGGRNDPEVQAAIVAQVALKAAVEYAATRPDIAPLVVADIYADWIMATTKRLLNGGGQRTETATVSQPQAATKVTGTLGVEGELPKAKTSGGGTKGQPSGKQTLGDSGASPQPTEDVASAPIRPGPDAGAGSSGDEARPTFSTAKCAHVWNDAPTKGFELCTLCREGRRKERSVLA
jgi:hypothetical protein